MNTGQRKHERIPATHLRKGSVCLDKSQKCFQVERVRDVSPFGIGLIIDGAISVGEKVRMRFAHDHSHIQMYGRVAWCAPAEADPGIVGEQHLFRMGVNLA